MKIIFQGILKNVVTQAVKSKNFALASRSSSPLHDLSFYLERNCNSYYDKQRINWKFSFVSEIPTRNRCAHLLISPVMESSCGARGIKLLIGTYYF